MRNSSGEVAVVIVNYNSQDFVIRCLASLMKHVSQKLCLIVVDNSEQDDTSKIRENFKTVICISNAENGGFAAGCNIGMKKAIELNVGYILLLNPDTLATDDFIDPLLMAMEQNLEFGIVCPKILLNDNEKHVWYGGSTMNWWFKGPVQLTGKSEEDLVYGEVPFISGCAMFIRSAAVKSIGYMDEDYFLYFEDADYCQRFLVGGWKLGYIAEATIFHYLSATIGVQSENAVYFISRNRVKFLRHWAKWYQFLFFMLFNTLVKLPGAVIIFGLIKGKPELAKAYSKGFWDGVRGKLGSLEVK